MLMAQTMRWFGPDDPVTLAEIRQTGATGIFTALHDVANGDVWSHAAIGARKHMIAAAGLVWRMVESLPVHEEIKTGGAGTARLVDVYRQSLRNNFMPLFGWTRTDLDWRMPDQREGFRTFHKRRTWKGMPVWRRS